MRHKLCTLVSILLLAQVCLCSLSSVFLPEAMSRVRRFDEAVMLGQNTNYWEDREADLQRSKELLSSSGAVWFSASEYSDWVPQKPSRAGSVVEMVSLHGLEDVIWFENPNTLAVPDPRDTYDMDNSPEGGMPGTEEPDEGYPAEQVYLVQPIMDPNTNVTQDQDHDQGQEPLDDVLAGLGIQKYVKVFYLIIRRNGLDPVVLQKFQDQTTRTPLLVKEGRTYIRM